MIKIAILNKENKTVFVGPYTGHEDEATELILDVLPSFIKHGTGYSVVLQNKKGQRIKKKTAEQFLKDGGM